MVKDGFMSVIFPDCGCPARLIFGAVDKVETVLDKTPLRIDVATLDGTTIRLALSGDLDYDTVAELAGLTFDAGYRRLDVDLSGLAFIDSSGLAALVRLQRQVEGADAELRVVALTPYLRNLLRITALDKLFPLPPPT
jgi:anti-sigma B factor antagonist